MPHTAPLSNRLLAKVVFQKHRSPRLVFSKITRCVLGVLLLFSVFDELSQEKIELVRAVDFAANGGKVAVFVSFTTFAICRKSKIVMQNLLNELKSLLAEQPRFTLEGRMIKQAVIDAESKEFGMSETVKAVMTVFYNLKTHAQ
jgi:hypothetical protein